MTAAICDNEKIFIEQLETLIRNIPEIERYDTYHDLELLRKKVEEGISYDLIFMDIEWNQDENGIRFAAKINELYPKTQIIFITSYNEMYSQEIFFENINLCGYLVKPIEEVKLKKLVEKAFNNLVNNKRRYLTIQYRGKTENLPYDEVRYLESKGHQVIIHGKQTDYVIYDKLDEIAKRSVNGFVSIHKSYLVNMDQIRKMEGKNLYLADGTVLPISKAKVVTAKETYLRYMRSQM